ncbi:MAG: lytic transglycosylase domain-containing protein [Gammaproteobacteria bacterium]
MVTRVLLAAIWLLLAAGAAAGRSYTGDEDLPTVWAQYLAEHASREPVTRFPFGDCFRRAAIVNRVPETLLLAVARGESDFDPDARSHANAHGVMQILWPGTARHLGLYLLSELYEPCRNIDAGARYLKELLAHYDGDLHLALAAYNYGPARIRADGPIPPGAEWYSGYIYRHLQYVLGRSTPAAAAPTDYRQQDKVTLISFSEPYRARAFVAALERDPGGLAVDWFRAGQTEFRVVLLYSGAEDLERSRRRLARAGFLLP